MQKAMISCKTSQR